MQSELMYLETHDAIVFLLHPLHYSQTTKSVPTNNIIKPNKVKFSRMKVLTLALITLLPHVVAIKDYVYDNKCDNKYAVENCHDCDFYCVGDGWEMKKCKCDCKDNSWDDITYTIKYDCDYYNCKDSDSCDSDDDSDDDCNVHYLSTSDDEDCHDEGSEYRCERCCKNKCNRENDDYYCAKKCWDDCIDDAECDDASDDSDESCDYLESYEDRRCRNKSSESKCEE